MRWFVVVVVVVVVVMPAACGSEAPQLSAVGARGCGEGTLVRDPHERFSFCTPYNAWVSTMHADDEHEGPYDYTFYALRPGTSFAVTVHDRGAPPADVPKDARVETDRAMFHGRNVEHQRARFHVHDAEDHDVTLERWTTPQGAGSITIATRVQEDTSAELRARLAEVVGSFRFGR